MSNELPRPTMDLTRSSSWTLGERLCAAFIPFIAVVEVLVWAVTDCFDFRRPFPRNRRQESRDIARLADETRFSVNEVEALYELFKKLSSLIIDDGSIHKEELQLALFQTSHGENIFLDQVFDLFDERKNGVIEFDEFVHALSVFHPHAPLEEKIDFTFRLYDLRQTGFIEREEVKQMVAAIMMEFETKLPNDLLEAIVDNESAEFDCLSPLLKDLTLTDFSHFRQTFADADVDKDGRISKEEWKAFAIGHPRLLKNMTLPYLKDVTTIFPNFISNTEIEE